MSKIRHISVRVTPDFFNKYENLANQLKLNKTDLIYFLFNFYNEKKDEKKINNNNNKKYENGGITDARTNLIYGKIYNFSQLKNILKLPDNININNFNYRKYGLKKVFLIDRFYLI